LYAIPPALADRMEIIRLPGYLETEKVQIAKQFLLPKQLEAAGLAATDVKVGDKVLRSIVNQYTREAGVRNLERELATLCRKIARKKASGNFEGPVTITEKSLAKYLGPERFVDSEIERKSRIGVANGLAWTETGGDLLTIEVTTVPGKGDLLLTGKLG